MGEMSIVQNIGNLNRYFFNFQFSSYSMFLFDLWRRKFELIFFYRIQKSFCENTCSTLHILFMIWLLFCSKKNVTKNICWFVQLSTKRVYDVLNFVSLYDGIVWLKFSFIKTITFEFIFIFNFMMMGIYISIFTL